MFKKIKVITMVYFSFLSYKADHIIKDIDRQRKKRSIISLYIVIVS